VHCVPLSCTSLKRPTDPGLLQGRDLAIFAALASFTTSPHHALSCYSSKPIVLDAAGVC
jgi:hypothetical protein